MKHLAVILILALPVPAQVQEKLDGYVLPLKMRDDSACFANTPQVCRTPWIKYERITLESRMSVFDQRAWVCESRNQKYWCFTEGGESCACSGKPPPGEWKREGEETGLHDEIRKHVIEPCAEAVSPFLGIGAGVARYSYRLELGKVEDAIVTAAHGKPEAVRHGIYEAGARLCALFIEQAAPGSPARRR